MANKKGDTSSITIGSIFKNSFMKQILVELEIGKWLRNTKTVQKLNIKKLCNKVSEQIYNSKIHVEIIPVRKNSNGTYYIQNTLDTIVKRYGEHMLNKPFIIIPLKINENNEIDLGKNCSCINIQHNNILGEYKKKLNNILKKEFGNNAIWDGSINKTICIKV